MYRLVLTLYTLPMSLWDYIYGGFNTRRYTSVHGLCFPIGCIGLNTPKFPLAYGVTMMTPYYSVIGWERINTIVLSHLHLISELH